MIRRTSQCMRGLAGVALLSGCMGRNIDFSGGTGGVANAGGSGATGELGGGGAGTGGSTGEFVAIVEAGSNAGGAGASPTSACPVAHMPSEATLPGYTAPRSEEVANALSNLTSLDPLGKYKQMYGVDNPPTRDFVAYGNIQQSQDVNLSNGLTVRGFKYRDGTRGVNLDAQQPNNRPSKGRNYSTAFPAASIRAASWDVDLEMQVGEAIGDEVMASLNNVLLAPSADILRHPYWGRSQESYGEDAYHVGRMASAFTAGVQQHVVACATHYVAGTVENSRENLNAAMNEQMLREVYARPFGMVVSEGGVGCVMAAYNLVNQVKSTVNKHLLRDILKAPVAQNGFGFRGFVISDWWAMEGGSDPASDSSLAKARAANAVEAGLDVELPWSLNFSYLSTLVESGQLSGNLIDDSVGRILEQKFRFGTAYTSNPWGLGTADTKLGAGERSDSIVDNQKHLALAEEVEIRSAVLLKNGSTGSPVLPIKSPGSIAVVGLDRAIDVSISTNLQPDDDGILQFASEINTGDRGTSRVNSEPAASIGPYAGIKAAAAAHGVTNVTRGNSVEAAEDAEFVVVVVGLNAGDEGEEYSVRHLGDRSSLDLPDRQNEFVSSVLDLNKPTVVIIESGSIVNVPWLSHSNQSQATIWAGYSGQHGGAAYGKLLFGDRNFGGKLPVSWPRESDLNRVIPFQDGTGNTVRMDYFFGYRAYDRYSKQEVELVFPFGHGLSYTEFKYSNLQIPCTNATKTDVVYVTAEVENTGAVAGDETMMLFVQGPPAPAGITGYRPLRELKRFQRVNNIQPAGQPRSHFKVTFPINIQDLRHWEGDDKGRWIVDSGEYTISIGGNIADLPLQGKLTVVD